MSPKARFIGYINLLILLSLVLIYLFRTLIAFSVGGGNLVFPFLIILILVFIVWGVVNAVKYLRRKTLSNWERALLSISLVNLTLLLIGIVAISQLD